MPAQPQFRSHDSDDEEDGRISRIRRDSTSKVNPMMYKGNADEHQEHANPMFAQQSENRVPGMYIIIIIIIIIVIIIIITITITITITIIIIIIITIIIIIIITITITITIIIIVIITILVVNSSYN